MAARGPVGSGGKRRKDAVETMCASCNSMHQQRSCTEHIAEAASEGQSGGRRKRRRRSGGGGPGQRCATQTLRYACPTCRTPL